MTHAMRLDTTLHACGTGQHRGRHLKIHLYHNRRHFEYKVFEPSSLDINILIVFIGYKYPN